jgi:hypothetical protein
MPIFISAERKAGLGFAIERSWLAEGLLCPDPAAQLKPTE